MSTNQSTTLLRNVLLLDAAASGATAALLIAGAGLLDGLLGLPVALMREAGLILVPYVAFVAWVGTREGIARGAVWAIVAANALWVVARVGLGASLPLPDRASLSTMRSGVRPSVSTRRKISTSARARSLQPAISRARSALEKRPWLRIGRSPCWRTALAGSKPFSSNH